MKDLNYLTGNQQNNQKSKKKSNILKYTEKELDDFAKFLKIDLKKIGRRATIVIIAEYLRSNFAYCMSNVVTAVAIAVGAYFGEELFFDFGGELFFEMIKYYKNSNINLDKEEITLNYSVYGVYDQNYPPYPPYDDINADIINDINNDINNEDNNNDNSDADTSDSQTKKKLNLSFDNNEKNKSSAMLEEVHDSLCRDLEEQEKLKKDSSKVSHESNTSDTSNTNNTSDISDTRNKANISDTSTSEKVNTSDINEKSDRPLKKRYLKDDAHVGFWETGGP
jgi:hypothetical protein